MIKIISKKALFICAIIILGGLGGIVADRYLFPYLATTDFFMKHGWLKKGSEDVTVINKTEQVFVKEETSIAKISNQAASSVVSIISYPAANAGGAHKTAANGVRYGTGVIVTSDGLIMTYVSAINPNNSKYKVITFDGRTYDAEISGIDAFSNLAFLKISASNLPAVSFGNSSDISAGEKVIEIGINPGSANREYSAGLISNFDPYYNLGGNSVSSSEKLEGIFQGDFSNDPEYVGGPVVDYNGQVIGIIGSVERNGAQNFFQIPSNAVAKVIDRAIKKETDQDPILGIYYLPLNESYALINNLDVKKGALIFSASGQPGLAILSGSPAQKSGLQLGDIITKINSQEINENNPLSGILYQYKKGTQIELTVLRGGQEMNVSVQL